MRKGSLVTACLIGMLVLVEIHCSKDSSPTQAHVGPQLNAVPSAVTVGVGVSQTVAVSGGTPPYGIEAAPSTIATAVLLNPDSATSSVQITGVTVASVSTAVTIKDNSTSETKTVTIPIRVQ
jgi:hypothetical protein